MNRFDAAILIIRAFALFAFFKGLEFVEAYSTMYFAYSMSGQGSETVMLSFALIPLSWLVIAVYLFIRSRQVAVRLLLPPELAPDEPPPVHPVALASAGFSVIGVAAVVYAFPQLLQFAFSIVAAFEARHAPLGGVEGKLLASAAQAVLGFLLFFKSRAFATLWWRKQAPHALVSTTAR